MKNKEEVKNEIFKAAQERATMTRTELDELFKKQLLEDGFSVQEIISMAKEYSQKYPMNSINGLDRELRIILSPNYFDTRTYTEKYPDLYKAIQEKNEMGILDKIFGKTGLPNWGQWLLIGGVAIVTVPSLLRLFKKR